jgi:hypothetical protein
MLLAFRNIPLPCIYRNREPFSTFRGCGETISPTMCCFLRSIL